jgi:hypothetical protein
MSSEDAADYLNEMTQVQLRIFAVRSRLGGVNHSGVEKGN